MSHESKREILGTSRISYRYQITIPKEVRDRFGIKDKDILVFLDEDGKLVLRKGTQVVS